MAPGWLSVLLIPIFALLPASRALALTATIVATDPSASADGSDPGEFSVLLDAQAPPGGIAVNYSVGGTAVPGLDYHALGGNVLIPEGQDSGVVSVDPIATYSAEDKTVVAVLDPGPGYQVGQPSSATVTIWGVGLIATIEATDPTASADGSDSGEFTVRVDPQAPPGGIVVSYSVGGTAVPGLDYHALAENVVIPEGQASGAISVDPIATYSEEDKTVVAILDPGPDYEVGQPSDATVTIWGVGTAAMAREIWVSPAIGHANVSIGDWAATGVSGTHFTFSVPVDFLELVSVKVVMIGKRTAESSADVYLSVSRQSRRYDDFTDELIAVPLAVTAGHVIELDISSVFPSLTAGADYASVHFRSRFVHILGLRFVYNAN